MSMVYPITTMMMTLEIAEEAVITITYATTTTLDLQHLVKKFTKRCICVPTRVFKFTDLCFTVL